MNQNDQNIYTYVLTSTELANIPISFHAQDFELATQFVSMVSPFISSFFSGKPYKWLATQSVSMVLTMYAVSVQSKWNLRVAPVFLK